MNDRLTIVSRATAVALIMLASAQAASGRTADCPSSVDHAPPMNQTVQTRLSPQIEAILLRLLAEGRGLQIDGVEVFRANDKFLPGKIAIAMAHLLEATPPSDPRFAEQVAAFRSVSDMMVGDDVETWGIYYYLSALQRLDRLGVLEQGVSPETLEYLRHRLDWRAFVREEDLTLVDLPNNYYGVAYSVAQLRNLLGWEDDSAAEALLGKTLEHYATYSDYGFADETDGQGRFDRYSVLLIGEIAQRFIDIGRQPPAEVLRWLRQSADVVLLRAGPEGEGFEYGRSIGAYGETAMLEVLSAAAVLGVLTPEEMDVAYAVSSTITARYVDFWVDAETGSVNLWDHGRRTDAYRGKHRILGENLSLGHQHTYTNALWNRLGYRDRLPTSDLAIWRASRPRATLTWFDRGEHDRALLTVIDGQRMIGLPIINGGAGQHMNNPYFPIPFSPGVVAGAADAAFPQLITRFELADGSVLQPLAFHKDVQMTETAEAVQLDYRQDTMDRMGENAPVADARMGAWTRYRFTPGQIERSDLYTTTADLGPATLTMEFAGYQPVADIVGDNNGWTVTYRTGPLTSMRLTGLDTCETAPVEPVHASPTGPFLSLVRCRSSNRSMVGPIRTGWVLTYDPAIR